METGNRKVSGLAGLDGARDGGGGRNFYMAYLITDVRAEWPPFSALPGIWLAPFFQQKVYDWPHFSWFVHHENMPI